ncbi:MAG: nitroreductase family deazaflavin-dependent oxidoreductase [Myxococcota bacterium]
MRKSTARDEKVVNFAARFLGRIDRWIYRVSGGNRKLRILGRGKAEGLLLTTTGRKSGLPRTTPLLYLKDGDNVVIVASKAGMPHHPQWYLNVQARPEVTVEIGAEKIPMTARMASPGEKASLWPRLVEIYPSYDDYQARTDRDIPVLILSRKRSH